jgi:hypothetical protein
MHDGHNYNYYFQALPIAPFLDLILQFVLTWVIQPTVFTNPEEVWRNLEFRVKG